VVGLLLQAAYFTLLYLALDLESSAGTVALIVSLSPSWSRCSPLGWRASA
jgi:hypothetical protein